MKNQILVKRYTQGLVSSIKDQKEFEILSQQLADFFALLQDQDQLHQALTNPFLPRNRKVEIGKEVVSKGEWTEKTSRFIVLLIENARIELLGDILESLPILWDEQRGISTIEVCSAVPLEEDQKRRLKEKLEILEKGPVSLKYRIDGELIGGFSLRKENIVYDVSIRGSLENLKEKIIEEQEGRWK
jgi:F-type H+-transporting ATPase subunit delta